MTPVVDHKVCIIGAGLAGLGMAINIKKELGVCDGVEIYERGSNLGGTWFWNTYPGAACDIPSLFYSYSFAPLIPTQTWADQHEILDYMKHTAKAFDIDSKITYNSECVRAVWDDQLGLWTMTFRNTLSGASYSKTAKVLIAACGSFSTPNDCPAPGGDKFRGSIFHSSRWNHAAPLKDKNVIVIGNGTDPVLQLGCTAAQVVPALLDANVKSITQLIRSPHNIQPAPLPQRPYSSVFRWLLRVLPGFRAFVRFVLFMAIDFGFLSFETKRGQTFRKFLNSASKDYIRKKAPAKYLDILLPDFEFGAKRRIIDYAYLDSLHSPLVSLHKDQVAEITETGVVTKTGKSLAADVIVNCTGFKVSEYLLPMQIVGQNGTNLHEQWRQGYSQAYKGAYVHNFPNFVLCMGPNTGTGHSSVIFSIECQFRHAMGYLRPLLVRSGSWLSPKPPVKSIVVTKDGEESYNVWIRRRLQQLIWHESGEGGWYIDKKTGHNATVFPHFQTLFWWINLRVKWKDFQGNRGSLQDRGLSYDRSTADSHLGNAASAIAASAASGDRLTRLTGMSLDEAKKILDVEEKGKITKEAIEKKYGRLFEVNDPKNGGSIYVQSKVFRAKERLELEMKEGAGSARDTENSKP
ncbi:hypothetical protein HDU91_004476 [Kappamyces sp. JEL0680]|nr:hypothetical protein HDU91_004476 [Kappamyces sp. JEL0680]